MKEFDKTSGYKNMHDLTQGIFGAINKLAQEKNSKALENLYITLTSSDAIELLELSAKNANERKLNR